MKPAYRPLVAIGLVLVGVAAVVAYSGQERPELVKWETDMIAAQERSQREHKPILMYFTASWCGPCQRMKHTTFGDPGVAELMAAKYVPLKFEIDGPSVNRGWASTYGINPIPAFVIIGEDGAMKRRWDDGYMDEAAFAAWLKG